MVNLVNQLPFPTNLHTHGLHVSPIGSSDNILLDIEPGDSHQFHIEIPADHPQGLYCITRTSTEPSSRRKLTACLE